MMIVLYGQVPSHYLTLNMDKSGKETFVCCWGCLIVLASDLCHPASMRRYLTSTKTRNNLTAAIMILASRSAKTRLNFEACDTAICGIFKTMPLIASTAFLRTRLLEWYCNSVLNPRQNAETYRLDLLFINQQALYIAQ